MQVLYDLNLTVIKVTEETTLAISQVAESCPVIASVGDDKLAGAAVAAEGPVPDDISQFYQQLDKDDEEDEATDPAASAAVAFEVDPDKIEVSGRWWE